MSTPIAFRPRVKATTPLEASAGEWFNLTIVLGPFVVGDPAPVWADVAALVVAEARREWEQQQHAEPGTTQTPA